MIESTQNKEYSLKSDLVLGGTVFLAADDLDRPDSPGMYCTVSMYYCQLYHLDDLAGDVPVLPARGGPVLLLLCLPETCDGLQ